MDSYESFLDSMVNRYEQLSGNKLKAESDIMIRMKVLAGEVYNLSNAMEFVKRQMFVSSASGDYLDKHAQFRGLERKQSQKAKGEVTFFVETESASDIVIEKGTVVATMGETFVQFETDKSVTLKAGTKEVTATVTALVGGFSGNAVKNAVVVMVTPPQGITGVTNKTAFTGGTDTETDEQLRARVINSYKDIPNGTNAVYYKRLATSHEQVVSASVVPRVRGAGTINVYIKGNSNTALSDEVINEVQRIMDKNRELNVSVKVENASVRNVSFSLELDIEDGYVRSEVESELRSKIDSYISQLEVGQPVLLCNLSEIVYHTPGVKNFEFLTAFCSDVYPNPNESCVLSSLTIKAVT